MWFELPTNVSGISVQRQDFKPEHVTADNKRYFRAPEHFAPEIINMGLGIRPVVPGEDWPDDLPPEVVSNAIGDLSKEVTSLKTENENLRTLLSGARRENFDLLAKVEDLSKRLEAALEAPEPKPESQVESKKAEIKK